MSQIIIITVCVIFVLKNNYKNMSNKITPGIIVQRHYAHPTSENTVTSCKPDFIFMAHNDIGNLQ